MIGQAAAASAPTARQQRVPTQMQADRPSVERKLARQLASQQGRRTSVPLFSFFVLARSEKWATGKANLNPTADR